MDSKVLYSGQELSLARRGPDIPSARDAALIDLARARVPRRPRVLELSVGDGTLSWALARAFPEAELTLADISRPHLEATAALLATIDVRPTLVEANLDHDFVKLPDASFDLVFALDILEHVFDVFGFVAHCRRVLTSRGTLLLRVPNVGYLRHRWSLLRGELPVTASWFGPPGELGAWRDRYGWDGGHLHYFTLPTLGRLLADAGFSIERVMDAGARFAKWREIAPGLLCGNLVMVARPRL